MRRPMLTIEARKSLARFCANLDGLLRLAMEDTEWDHLTAKWMGRFGIVIW